jgi:hypothetical protein
MVKFKTKKNFSFASIVEGRDASVRVTDDGLLVAVDLAMVVSKKSQNNAGKDLRNLKENIFSAAKFTARDMPGAGNKGVKLVAFNDAIELIMVLPGKSAKCMRKQFANIIVRYLDGDRSMCTEIKKNKAMGKLKSYSKFASGAMKSIDNDDDMLAKEMPPTRYVYATKSTAYPGLVKIGKTGDLKARVSQLKTATAPAPHVIVAVAPTFDQGRDEDAAHAFFADCRREGEFFETDVAPVSAYFATHITAQYNTELAQHIAMLQGMHL